jgi:hypothetical protein
MEAIANYIPFLASYGPIIVALGIGYVTANHLNKPNERRNDTANVQGHGTSTDHRSENGTGRNVAGRTEDEDEDNLVHLEDTVVRDSSPQQQVPVDANAEADYDCMETDCDAPQIPFVHTAYSDDVMLEKTQRFYELMNNRRSLRFFSNRHVPIEVIENIVKTAGESRIKQLYPR